MNIGKKTGILIGALVIAIGLITGCIKETGKESKTGREYLDGVSISIDIDSSLQETDYDLTNQDESDDETCQNEQEDASDKNKGEEGQEENYESADDKHQDTGNTPDEECNDQGNGITEQGEETEDTGFESFWNDEAHQENHTENKRAQISESRAKAAKDWEAGWSEIAEELLNTGEYVIELSGYGDFRGPAEKRIWQDVEFYLSTYYERTTGSDEDLIDVQISGNKATLTLTESGQKILAVEDKIIKKFGTVIMPTEDATVVSTVNRVASRMSYSVEDKMLPLGEAVEKSSGVCWTYSQIGKVLLNAQGIPARTVIGRLDGYDVLHEWVEAYFGGEWHVVDFTFKTIDGNGYHVDESAGRMKKYEDVLKDVANAIAAQKQTTLLSIRKERGN